MDDEAADIELLEQHLNKTSLISQRMTTILSQFDTRLGKLEKSILPLHKSTQALTRLSENIESTLQSIDKIASDQEGIAAEEALILRGPRPGDLVSYTEALERLNANIAFKTSDRTQRETAKLLEQGTTKLTQFFTKLVAEASSGTPPSTNDLQPVPFPPSVLQTLEPVLVSLRSLPLPATHPSHPAAPGILQALKEAQRGYGDMRGAWARKCLEMFGQRRVVERVETMDGISGGQEIGRWVQNLLNVAKTEYQLLETLAPMPAPALLQPTYDTILTPLLTAFTTTFTSLIALIKRNLQKYVVLALSTYDSVSIYQSSWDDIMRLRAGRKDNELKENIHALRGVCLRSFPEFLMDIKAVAAKPGGESAGLANITTIVLNYLNQLPAVREATGEALLTLGDGNWKMGDGAPKASNARDADGDEQLVLEHFVYDVITTLLATLASLGRSHRRPALGTIFQLNNVSYARDALLSQSTPVDSLLSKPARDALNSSVRTAKAAYFDSNFSPLIQALSDTGKKDKDSKKGDLKDKLAKFYDALEEATDRHRSARVLPDDPAGREMLEDEVVRLVLPALKRFIERMGQGGAKESGFSARALTEWNVKTTNDRVDPLKSIKSSPDEVERQIRAFYR